MLFCENLEWNKKEVWNFIYVLTICEQTEHCARWCMFVHFPGFSFMNCRCVCENLPVSCYLPLALPKSSRSFIWNFHNPFVDCTNFIHNTGTLSKAYSIETFERMCISRVSSSVGKSREKKISLYWLKLFPSSARKGTTCRGLLFWEYTRANVRNKKEMREQQIYVFI
jgi:hypothetical protein